MSQARDDQVILQLHASKLTSDLTSTGRVISHLFQTRVQVTLEVIHLDISNSL